MLDMVVPVYNEGKNIQVLLDRIEDQVQTEKSVTIVYDMDTDDTLPMLEKIIGSYSYQVIKQKNNYGRGALNAIKTGIECSQGDAIVVIMADLSDSLEIIPQMYRLITEDGVDVVCGSRYMRGGKQHGGPLLKGIFSRVAGVSLHLLTRIPTHDISNSFKMYRTSMIRQMKIESTGGFEIGMEITVKAYTNGFKVAEIPSLWYDREEGKSNFKMWEWIPHYLHWYFGCVKCAWTKKGL